MQRREFLKGLVSLPLLAAIPAAALFKPRLVQNIVDGWSSEGVLSEIAIWDRTLSDKEIAFYFNRKPTLSEHMPALDGLQHWYRFGITENPFGPKRRWIPLVDTGPTGTVAAWLGKAA